MIDFEALKTTLLSDDPNAFIRLEDIPAIDLYMDQVTTLMDDHLSGMKRHPEDKILTKTMIQNYTKNRLLPPPEKKKYSREHVLLLLFIYYLKDFMSIGDIRTLTEPLSEACFAPEEGCPSIEAVYEEVLSLAKSRREPTQEELTKTMEAAGETFPDAPPEDAGLLRSISLIGALSYDILVRKRLIERLVDQLAADAEAEKNRGRQDLPSPKEKKKTKNRQDEEKS